LKVIPAEHMDQVLAEALAETVPLPAIPTGEDYAVGVEEPVRH
jgi:hypothetical protein